MKLSVKEMAVTAVMAAFICVISPFTVPVGIIPLSLASFAVYLASAILGAKKGTLSTAVYVLLGTFGVPVFSGFSGGLGKISGPTGGYIIGYLFCALVTGLIIDKLGDKIWAYPVAMIAGTAVLYAFGTAWFMIQSKNGLIASLTLCVIPFLIGDAVKIIVASGVAFSVRKTLVKRYGLA